MTAPTRPQHEIRAQYTDTTITVYQAYAPRIGRPAARDGRFPDVWKRDRRTWIIKPRSTDRIKVAGSRPDPIADDLLHFHAVVHDEHEVCLVELS